MSCQKVLELLSDYLDQQLSDDQYALVSSHLATCAQCWEIYKQMQLVKSFMNDLEEVEPPLDLKANVMAEILAIEEEEKDIEPRRASKQTKRRWHIKRLAAAFIIFFLSLGYGLQPVYMHAFEKSATEDFANTDGTMMIRSVAPCQMPPEVNLQEDVGETELTGGLVSNQEDNQEAIAENVSDTEEIQKYMITGIENVDNVSVKSGEGNKEHMEADVETPKFMLAPTDEDVQALSKEDEEEIDLNITVTSNEMVVLTVEDENGELHAEPEQKTQEKRFIISGLGVLLAAVLMYFSRTK